MKTGVAIYIRVGKKARGLETQKKEILADALSYMVHTGIKKMITLEPYRISRNPLKGLQLGKKLPE